MTEERLADLLGAVVPEPPPVSAPALTARARGRARRRTVASLAGALTLVVAVTAGVLALRPDDADRVTPLATPSGATPDPMTAPVRPRAELTAPPLPGPASGGAPASTAWTLAARSDDGRALLVTTTFPGCQGFERFAVDETDGYVLVTAVLRRPGVKTYCINNVPHVGIVSTVLDLATPLGDRTLLHAATTP